MSHSSATNSRKTRLCEKGNNNEPSGNGRGKPYGKNKLFWLYQSEVLLVGNWKRSFLIWKSCGTYKLFINQSITNEIYFHKLMSHSSTTNSRQYSKNQQENLNEPSGNGRGKPYGEKIFICNALVKFSSSGNRNEVEWYGCSIFNNLLSSIRLVFFRGIEIFWVFFCNTDYAWLHCVSMFRRGELHFGTTE